MTSQPARQKDNVLVLGDGNLDAWLDVRSELAENVPGAHVAVVHSISELRQSLQADECDVVVVDYELPLEHYRNLAYELKSHDTQPGLIVLSRELSPDGINDLYRHGCHRLIFKDHSWQHELTLSIRHLLRYRQVLDENVRIRTKLTEANQLLDERNRRLDEFSATLAHDIRGPLGSISMRLEYLLDHYNKGLDGRATQLMERALSSCKRLTDIVQAMYEYAKLGSKATVMSEIKLNDLVSEVLSDVHFDESLDIQVEIGDLPLVWGNPGLLRRIFMNLINNAVKYNDKKEVRVRIGTGRAVDKSIGSFVEVWVEDNGPGIPAGEAGEIFNMFRRGLSVERGVEGAGVGLAVVRRIAELHYGEVRLNSTPGQGARFTVLLPRENIGLES